MSRLPSTYYLVVKCILKVIVSIDIITEKLVAGNIYILDIAIHFDGYGTK
jgi:hypothetical protein